MAQGRSIAASTRHSALAFEITHQPDRADVSMPIPNDVSSLQCPERLQMPRFRLPKTPHSTRNRMLWSPRGGFLTGTFSSCPPTHSHGIDGPHRQISICQGVGSTSTRNNALDLAISGARNNCKAYGGIHSQGTHTHTHQSVSAQPHRHTIRIAFCSTAGCDCAPARRERLLHLFLHRRPSRPPWRYSLQSTSKKCTSA